MRHPARHPKARLSPAKDRLIVIEFARGRVEAMDVSKALEQLRILTASADAATRSEGAVTFLFEGWDDDPRELAEIPEVRRWFQKLNAEYPYWLHVGEKVGDTVMRAMQLLCRGRCVRSRPGLVGWRFDDAHEFGRVLQTLFNGMNGLHERLGLPEAMNERITQEIGELLGASFEAPTRDNRMTNETRPPS
jgi:hypothetical protein